MKSLRLNSADNCCSSTLSTPQPPLMSPVSCQSFSPLAKKIARDNNINLAQLKGTGPGGRVVRKDVEAALSGGQMSKSPVSNLRSSITNYHFARRQVVQPPNFAKPSAAAWLNPRQSIPHFYVTHEYKMDAVMDMRKQINAYLPDNEKLSVNDFIVKAVALGVARVPESQRDHQGQ
jgi:pyruvate dehydrogenase E2 component (dihydrolipoamide acetyltransferase)